MTWLGNGQPEFETGPRTFQMPVPPQFQEPTGDGEQATEPEPGTGTEEG